jgi:hypothetical protein
MAKVTEVVKEIAQTWQKLGKEDRQKYKEAAKRGKNSNSNHPLEFLPGHVSELKLILKTIDKERYEKELRSLVSHSDTLKKPKKCLSAYMIFVKEVPSKNS